MSIDTLILVANLKREEKMDLRNYFKFNNGAEHFYESVVSKSPWFVLNMNPKNKYAYKHYNVMLILQNNTLEKMPACLKEIIKSYKWIIKRIDIAFDFEDNYEHHVALKPHGNTKVIGKVNWDGYYIGSNYGRSKIILYDRNRKEISKKSNRHHSDKTRFEVRIRPKISLNKEINDLDDAFIIEELKRYKVIVNISNVKTSKWNKNRLQKLKASIMNGNNSYNDLWKSYSSRVKRELKQLFIKERIRFEELYLNQKENLFSWLT